MLIELPQFKPGVACADGQYPNACCTVCRKIGPEYDHWRLTHAGIARFDCPYKGKQKSMRGLGDAIERVTKAIGIKTCGDCKQRRDKLNELVPFN